MPTPQQRAERLIGLVKKSEQSYAAAQRLAESRGQKAPVRHKCFVAYHGADIDAVTDFVDEFNDVFIPRVIGVSDSDNFKDPIDSNDEEYIKKRIREKYLTDTTVTMVFVGACTWARKFIDWEISSSLRNDPVNKRNGLLGLTPSDRSENRLPSRFADNWRSKNENCYAHWKYYPTTESDLRAWIEDAFQARDGTRGARQQRTKAQHLQFLVLTDQVLT